MRIPLVALLWLALMSAIATPVSADELAGASANKAALEKLNFKDGQTVIFLGDSITFGCGWTEHVENYFYTRFPETKLRFVNAAVGGDRSWTLEERFEKSVAPLKPQHAFIMLGMNDGRYREFDPALYKRYQASMTAVLDRLRDMETNVIVLAPSHFDRRTRNAVREEPANNYNGVLQFYGNWLREEAWRRGLAFVDVNAAMSQMLVDKRKSNPDFKLTTDGIHTDATGDMVIAATVLLQIGMPAEVSSIRFVRSEEGWSHEVSGGTLSELEASDKSLRFKFDSAALPWSVGEDARSGYALTGASNKLNRQRLQISGLPPGKYELKIDGVPVSRYTSAELGAGIQLQDNANTPQHKQAQQVASLNRTRNNHMRSYTKGWFLWALRAPERAWVKEHQPGDDRYDEFNGRRLQSEEALKSTPKFLALADEMTPQVYEAARPKPHIYQIAAMEE